MKAWKGDFRDFVDLGNLFITETSSGDLHDGVDDDVSNGKGGQIFSSQQKMVPGKNLNQANHVARKGELKDFMELDFSCLKEPSVFISPFDLKELKLPFRKSDSD